MKKTRSRTTNVGAVQLGQWLAQSQRTQADVAAALDVDQSLVSYLVRGLRRPGRALAVKLQRVTGVNVDAWDTAATAIAK